MAALEAMVKRTLSTLAVALAAAACWGLGPRESMPLAAAVTAFPGVRPGPHASLLRHGDAVAAIFTDRDTTSLNVVEVPAAAALPASAPESAFIDRVDVAAPLGASFGEHAAGVAGGGLRLLYLDREREDRLLLKSVAADASGWRLSLLEPTGLPVAVLESADRKPLDVWAPGALLARGASGPDARLWPRITPRGAGVPIAAPAGGSPTGFTVWDEGAGVLLAVRTGAAGVQVAAVPGAGPVSAAAEAPDGTLAVVTWDPQRRRILLLERTPGASLFRTTTVTICDGTDGVFLAWTAAGWLFVYDEMKPAPLGRWEWEVGVLWPVPKAVGRAQYRRGVLSTGSGPVVGLRALVTADALFVLEVRDALRLLKIPLP